MKSEKEWYTADHVHKLICNATKTPDGREGKVMIDVVRRRKCTYRLAVINRRA